MQISETDIERNTFNFVDVLYVFLIMYDSLK